MDKRTEFIKSISEDIIQLNKSIDISDFTQESFLLRIKREIADLSTKYNLTSLIDVPYSKYNKIDIIWFLDSIPVVSFNISSCFSIKKVKNLNQFDCSYKFFVYYGILSYENLLKLKTIDKTGQISLSLHPNYNYSLFNKSAVNLENKSRRRRSKKHESLQSTTKKKKEELSKPKLSSSVIETYNFFKKGYSLSEIALHRDTKEETIANHIVKIMKSGEYLDLFDWIPQDKQDKIIQVSRKLNTNRLRPIKDVLGEEYSWNDIRMVLVKKERYDLFE